SELLSVFLEESNIRWGELVGGLLIVGCSSALVMNFWSRISELWIVQVSLFTGITAALFGAGLYAHRRWRLPTTSMGLLVIATLLTPLTFLLISAFGQGASGWAARTLLVEVIALGLLGTLLYRAAHIMTPDHPRSVSLTILILSALQLVLRRVAGSDVSSGVELLFGASPLLVYGGVIAWILRSEHPLTHPREKQTLSVLAVWALTTFPTLLALGLFLVVSGEPLQAATRMSSLVSLYGLPSLFCGLFFWRRREHLQPAWVLVASTTVGILGLAAMAAGTGLAWPHPGYLIPVLLLTGGVCWGLSFKERIPEAVIPASLLTVGAFLLFRLVHTHTLLNWTSTSPILVQAVRSGQAGEHLVPAAWLLVLLSIPLLRTSVWHTQTRWILTCGAGISALGFLLILCSHLVSIPACWQIGGIGLLWLLLSVLGANRTLFTLGQLALALSLQLSLHIHFGDKIGLSSQVIGLSCFALIWAALRCSTPPREISLNRGWRLTPPNPGTGSVPALRSRTQALLRTDAISADQVLLAVALLGLVLDQWGGIIPRLTQEITSSPQLPGMDPLSKFWIPALVCTAAAIIVNRFSGPSRIRIGLPAALMICAVSSIPLFAGFWAPALSVSSAMRWGAAAFVMAGFRLPRPYRMQTLTIGGGLLLTLSLGFAFLHFPLGTPGYLPPANTFFARIGLAANHRIPLRVLGVALVLTAIREKRGRYAFAGILMGNVILLTLSLLTNPGWALSFPQTLLHFLQVNAAWSGTAAVVWLCIHHVTPAPSLWAKRQLFTAAGLFGASILPPLVMVILHPHGQHTVAAAAGGLWGWTAWMATLSGVWILQGVKWSRRTILRNTGLTLATATSLIALRVVGSDAVLSYRLLMMGPLVCTVAGIGLVILLWHHVQDRKFPNDPEKAHHSGTAWIFYLPGFTCLLALRTVLPPLSVSGRAAW
ncbi:MAG: hypothetical protein PF795_00170, partial [Kiritimatiellae bacterium]|nr:hypothetical protein [Kiritimatiellia bacterium]